MGRRTITALLLAAGLLLTVYGYYRGELRDVADVMTYGNFDFSPSEGQSV